MKSKKGLNITVIKSKIELLINDSTNQVVYSQICLRRSSELASKFISELDTTARCYWKRNILYLTLFSLMG